MHNITENTFDLSSRMRASETLKWSSSSVFLNAMFNVNDC